MSQYIGSTWQACTKLHFIAMHCSISHCRAKEKALVATTTYIYELISSITIHFYFLLCSFNSYLKTISSHQSSTNFCTDNISESFVDPKIVLDSIKSSSWKFFNFWVAGGDVDRSYVLCKLCFNSGNRKIGQVKYCGALLREAII